MIYTIHKGTVLDVCAGGDEGANDVEVRVLSGIVQRCLPTGRADVARIRAREQEVLRLFEASKARGADQGLP